MPHVIMLLKAVTDPAVLNREFTTGWADSKKHEIELHYANQGNHKRWARPSTRSER